MNNVRKFNVYEAIRITWSEPNLLRVHYYEIENAKEMFCLIRRLEKKKVEYSISVKRYREEVPNVN